MVKSKSVAQIDRDATRRPCPQVNVGKDITISAVKLQVPGCRTRTEDQVCGNDVDAVIPSLQRKRRAIPGKQVREGSGWRGKDNTGSARISAGSNQARV